MDDPQKYIYYWYMTEAQHTLFLEYLNDNGGEDPFKQLSDGNWYLPQKGNEGWFADLTEFDEEDGIGGAYSFGASYWTLSTVPSIFKP